MALTDSTEKFLSQGCPACGRLGGMKNPELTHVGWLGPKDEMDRCGAQKFIRAKFEDR